MTKILVDWPDDLTRERLALIAERLYRLNGYENKDEHDIHRLAAIAPEAPKKRMVNLWWNDAWSENSQPMCYPANIVLKRDDGWRKVNSSPVEISE